MRILVVEDERKLAQVLQTALNAEHYEVVLAPTGEDGFFRASAESFDLVLLDLMLPGRNGLDILQALRTRQVQTPVLILTARDGIDDRVRGIPHEHRERIFHRFFRVDQARSRERGGAGLGLAIAKWAVDIHGGQITVQEPAHGGSEFHIRLAQRKWRPQGGKGGRRITAETSMTLLGWLIVAALGWGSATLPQTTQAGGAMDEVSRTLDAARKEIATYKTAAGAPGAADHPAIKWDAALWAYREKYPRSEAATLASTEAVRLLVRAEFWDRAYARLDSVQADDPAWERLVVATYEAGIARKDVPSSVDRISRVAAVTTNARVKSSALVVLGRAHRRQGNIDAAVQSFEAAKAAAPGTPYAEEATGLLYEVQYLSPGLPAPPISGTARSGRAVTLDGFRGKAVVLVFWGTT